MLNRISLVTVALALSLATAVVLVGVAPAPASAGTIRTYSDPADSVYELEYLAAPGETNQLVITREGSGIRVTDLSGAPVTNAGSCVTQVSPSEIVCASLTGEERMTFATLDGDDSIGFGDAALAAEHVTVNGGDGNDTIRGSAFGEDLLGGRGNDTISAAGGDDEVDGGDGDDTLDGGPGKDRVKYVGSGALSVDIAIGSISDPRGGSDRMTGFESTLVVGHKSTSLRGTDDGEGIHGVGERVSIKALGGDDDVYGYAPAPLTRRVDIDLGSGDDVGEAHPEGTIKCGPGEDIAAAGHRVLIATDCEWWYWFSGGLRATLPVTKNGFSIRCDPINLETLCPVRVQILLTSSRRTVATANATIRENRPVRLRFDKPLPSGRRVTVRVALRPRVAEGGTQIGSFTTTVR